MTQIRKKFQVIDTKCKLGDFCAYWNTPKKIPQNPLTLFRRLIPKGAEHCRGTSYTLTTQSFLLHHVQATHSVSRPKVPNSRTPGNVPRRNSGDRQDGTESTEALTLFRARSDRVTAPFSRRDTTIDRDRDVPGPASFPAILSSRVISVRARGPELARIERLGARGHRPSHRRRTTFPEKLTYESSPGTFIHRRPAQWIPLAKIQTLDANVTALRPSTLIKASLF